MTSSQGSTVVVLGGGIGGVTAARKLREQLRPEDNVIVVEKSDRFFFAGTTLWVLEGERTREDLTRPYANLASLGIDLRQAEFTGLNTDNRTVQTSTGDISYDYLVVALGAELHMEAIPGLQEAGLNLYEPFGAAKLREQLLAFSGGKIVISVASQPTKCPVAPYEAAFIIDALLRKQGTRDQCSIDLYTPEPMPVGAAGKEAAQRLTAFMAERGITIHADAGLKSVDPTAHTLTLTNDTTAEFDILAAVPPHMAPASVRGSSIAGPAGWVPVDHDTLATKVEGVYALGDVSGLMLPSGRPLPKAAAFAKAEAEIIAHNIAVQVTGSGDQKTFVAIGACHLETGDGKAFAVEGNFSAAPNQDVRLSGPDEVHHAAKEELEQSALALV